VGLRFKLCWDFQCSKRRPYCTTMIDTRESMSHCKLMCCYVDFGIWLAWPWHGCCRCTPHLKVWHLLGCSAAQAGQTRPMDVPYYQPHPCCCCGYCYSLTMMVLWPWHPSWEAGFQAEPAAVYRTGVLLEWLLWNLAPTLPLVLKQAFVSIHAVP
jgi:hypothetical protein